MPASPAASSTTAAAALTRTTYRWVGAYQGAQGDVETTQPAPHGNFPNLGPTTWATLAQQLGLPKLLGQGSGNLIVVKWLGCFYRRVLDPPERPVGTSRVGRHPCGRRGHREDCVSHRHFRGGHGCGGHPHKILLQRIYKQTSATRSCVGVLHTHGHPWSAGVIHLPEDWQQVVAAPVNPRQ